ncbi:MULTISPECIES: hypothetical protein [Staphylococcus]|nr:MULTISPECIES: hypothetical protein [Staphylococcus]DAH60904.1 MAG TPA: Protein of unknown function (DUF1514) [Caudoviricetes sp.]ADC88348.1 hypothetical protein SLGD_02261 [Staphylococcus lugdunensis HKU09-01]MCH8639781.1 hypothetical protein [Staphylococcus lugdunensis]MCH8655245.1 hypothetical protein [Staphylococcus lugdunensis]MCH8657728.1 hypothetical protein [Staphylococcus lugdunensis]
MMWLVIAIILLVILVFGCMLEQKELKHKIEMKEYEIEVLRDKLKNGGSL